MADIDIPFNRDPISNEVKTGSYTIPASNYALVKVTQCGVDFEIDSNVVIHAHSYSGSQSVNTGNVTVFTNNTPYLLVGLFRKPTTGNNMEIRVGSSVGPDSSPYYGTAMQSAPGFSAESIGVTLPVGASLYVAAATGAGGTVSWNLSAVGPQHATEFWVKAGTQLDGDTYTVELYNSIS